MSKVRFIVSTKIILITLILISIMVYTIINIASNEGKYKQGDISDEDISKILNNIECLLSSHYQIMKEWKFQSYESIIGDKQLLKLVDTTNRYNTRNYEKVGLRISEYKSTLSLDAIEKIKDDTFLMATTFGVEFYLVGRSTLSFSKGEKHQFEVKNLNGEWYITKMYNDRKGSLSELKPSNEAKYRTTLESKIESITKLYNNTF